MPVNAPLTNCTTENCSRKNLLNWVNQKTSNKYNKIEELCSGVAYCQIMELLFPGSVPLKRIKSDAKLETDYIHNLKVFQNAFKKINVEKNVPIERLVKGKFQDNFEFLQWFKKFCDTNSSKCDEIKIKATPPLPRPQSTSSSAGKNLHKIIDTPVFFKSIPKRRSMQSTPISHKNLRSNEGSNGPSKSPLTIDFLSKQAEDLKKELPIIQDDRDFYFNKLRKIELIIEKEEAKGTLTNFLQKIKDILYCPEMAEAHESL